MVMIGGTLRKGMKFLNQREQNSEFDKNLDKKLTDLFNQGGMVITSYTLPWLIHEWCKNMVRRFSCKQYSENAI